MLNVEVPSQGKRRGCTKELKFKNMAVELKCTNWHILVSGSLTRTNRPDSTFQFSLVRLYRWFSQTRLLLADSMFTVLSQQSGEEGPYQRSGTTQRHLPKLRNEGLQLKMGSHALQRMPHTHPPVGTSMLTRKLCLLRYCGSDRSNQLRPLPATTRSTSWAKLNRGCKIAKRTKDQES